MESFVSSHAFSYNEAVVHSVDRTIRVLRGLILQMGLESGLLHKYTAKFWICSTKNQNILALHCSIKCITAHSNKSHWRCNVATCRLVIDITCVVHTRDEIPLKMRLEHLISCWG